MGHTWFYFQRYFYLSKMQYQKNAHSNCLQWKWFSHTCPDISIWLLVAWFLSVAQILQEGRLEDQKITFFLSKIYLIGFLRQHRLQYLSRVCRSKYQVLTDLIESISVVQVFSQHLMVSERRRSTMVHTGEIFQYDLWALLQNKNATVKFPRRIFCIAEKAYLPPWKIA